MPLVTSWMMLPTSCTSAPNLAASARSTFSCHSMPGSGAVSSGFSTPGMVASSSRRMRTVSRRASGFGEETSMSMGLPVDGPTSGRRASTRRPGMSATRSRMSAMISAVGAPGAPVGKIQPYRADLVRGGAVLCRAAAHVDVVYARDAVDTLLDQAHQPVFFLRREITQRADVHAALGLGSTSGNRVMPLPNRA